MRSSTSCISRPQGWPKLNSSRMYVRASAAPSTGVPAMRRANRTAIRPGFASMVPRSGGWLARRPNPASLPPWLSETDLDFYVGEFTRTGFRGGLNWYRNIDRNWELLAPLGGARVSIPALYIAGDRDLVVSFPGMDQLIPNLSTFVPQLRGTIMLSGCGHWTQQERAQEVNAAMIQFLRDL